MDQQKLAVDSGIWPIFRFNPELKDENKNPLTLDYKGPKIAAKDFMYNETRFKMVEKMDMNNAKQFLDDAEAHAHEQYRRYENLAHEFEKKHVQGEER
jgi:pyruvate-ferredoxin/flavodoxin oxidoreductase